MHSTVCGSITALKTIDAGSYQRYCAINVDALSAVYDEYYLQAVESHKSKFGKHPKYCFMVYEMERDILLNKNYHAAVKAADVVSPFNDSRSADRDIDKYIECVGRAAKILADSLENYNEYKLINDIYVFSDWNDLIKSVDSRADSKFITLLEQMKSDLDAMADPGNNSPEKLSDDEIACIFVLQLKNVLIYAGMKVRSASLPTVAMLAH